MRPTDLTTPASSDAAVPAVTLATGWIVLVIALAGLSLRPLMTTLGAALETIRLDLHLSSAMVGALASLPTFCMGVVALRGGWLISRMGTGQGMRVALFLIAFGCGARWLGDWVWVMFLATLVGGLGIACVQILMPVVVKQHFPAHAALMMGAFTTMMNMGAALGAVSIPVLEARLGGWQPALALWAIPALIAAWCWPRSLHRDYGHTRTGLPWRNALGWRMAVFLGTGSLAYMTLLAWLVPLYVALGEGQPYGVAMLTLFTVGQIAGALVVPPLANLSRDRRPALGITLGMMMLGLAGLWLAPTTASEIWVLLAGIGLGGSFPLALTLPLDYANTPAEAGRLSAMVQGTAMLMGALGPLFFGTLRDAFGFPVALLFLFMATVVSFLLGLTFRPPPIATTD